MGGLLSLNAPGVDSGCYKYTIPDLTLCGCAEWVGLCCISIGTLL